MKKLILLCFVTQAAMAFTPPSSPRSVINFNPDWKFIRQDVPGAEAVGFDDSKWEAVSTPHTYNETDTFDEITTVIGERSQYTGLAWYRKHFRLPAGAKGGKVFIEFEVTGPAIWRGGYNSGKPGSTNNKYLDTECGINRVAIRSTLQPGAITIKATRPGLEPAILKLETRKAGEQFGN